MPRRGFSRAAAQRQSRYDGDESLSQWIKARIGKSVDRSQSCTLIVGREAILLDLTCNSAYNELSQDETVCVSRPFREVSIHKHNVEHMIAEDK